SNTEFEYDVSRNAAKANASRRAKQTVPTWHHRPTDFDLASVPRSRTSMLLILQFLDAQGQPRKSVCSSS
ncbi:hypothetical protein AB9F35_36645, partial [Rhizobium leguminosarum]|uniref:hypothetical protein n=1 Tax=Rhizobium leguminosarum TaxID=384 RepID=UPI003F995C01